MNNTKIIMRGIEGIKFIQAMYQCLYCFKKLNNNSAMNLPVDAAY